jgi:hypothetical protein
MTGYWSHLLECHPAPDDVDLELSMAALLSELSPCASFLACILDILGYLSHQFHLPSAQRFSSTSAFIYSVFGPLAPFGAPVWNPFLNFLATCFKCCIRPVPVVFLLFAFSLHSSIGQAGQHNVGVSGTFDSSQGV